jgi:DOPA 4,5-dioxygenase
MNMQAVQGYHAHVYFNADTVDQARALCEEATQRFGLKMGRVHERPVGPHPDWSCQLAFEHAQLADVTLWLALNRKGLVVLLHPLTGDDLADHTEHAIWMGAVRALDVSIFKR